MLQVHFMVTVHRGVKTANSLSNGTIFQAIFKINKGEKGESFSRSFILLFFEINFLKSMDKCSIDC